MAFAHGKQTNRHTPRILLVDDEPVLVELFRRVIRDALECEVLTASSVQEARKLLSRQEVNLLITDVLLPDGNGLSLLGHLQRLQPCAASLVITGVPDVASAIGALRGGAVDFMPKPISADDLAGRVRSALAAQGLRQRRERRLVKLKDAVKKMNAARHLVTRKVDLLCNDLIGAYGDLSRRLDSVRVQQGYRQFIEQASGLEPLLCHTMDWMLRQVGYCNIGIWLASTDQEMQLGAFMKYTISAEPELSEALQRNLLRMAVRRGFVRLREGDAKAHLTPAEQKYLGTQETLAINCTYLGETLAVIVLFRDQKTPFSDDDISALKSITPLFALALTKSVRSIDGEHGDDEDGALPDESHPKHKKKDPADWWKEGEEPPF